jgi:1-acyl-sn-glycerol-3-phosphate acyltransferase
MSSRPVPLWRHLSFTLMWTSTAASGFGDRMIMLAALALLGGLVEDIANRSGIQAGTQFWFFLPYILFSIPAGWLADRLPRKWLLLTCDETRGLLLLLGFYLVAAASGPADIPAEHHWKVYAILFAIGTLAAVFNPTRNAIIPSLVPVNQLQAANAVILGINIIASLIGMIVGTQIIDKDSATSVRTGLLIASLFYMISGTFFAFLRVHKRHADVAAAQPVRHARSLRQAADYIRVHKRILQLMGLTILFWAAAAAVTSSLIGLGGEHYGLSGNEVFRFFGRMSATLGAGMLVGAAVMVAINTRRESPILMLAAITGAGACVLALAMIDVPALGYLLSFGIGFFGNITLVAAMTLLQCLSPDYVRGRVMGVNSMLNTIFSVATYFAIWRLPRADETLLRALYVVGPMLMVVGLYGLIRHLVRGPAPTACLNALWHIDRLYCLIWHGLQWRGRHHVPSAGGVLLVSNHTTAIDPLIIQAPLPRVVRWVMLSEHLFPALNWGWKRIRPIALDKNAGDVRQLRTIVAALRDGDVVGLFPEGRLQRERRELRPFQPGVGMIARRGEVAIVPCRIEGTPRRRRMLAHFLTPSRTSVTFGPPYRPAADLTHEQVADELRERILALADHTTDHRADHPAD